MAGRTLNELLALRQKLMAEQDGLRERLLILTAEIDIRLKQSRGEQLLAAMSDSDRELLTQTIRAKGIASLEAVNG